MADGDASRETRAREQGIKAGITEKSRRGALRQNGNIQGMINVCVRDGNGHRFRGHIATGRSDPRLIWLRSTDKQTA